MTMEVPAPKFEQFERVRIVGHEGRSIPFHDERGTIIWMDSYNVVSQKDRPEWMYIVELPTRVCYRTFFQSELQTEGTFSTATAHLGQRPEISFDVVLEEDNDWAEGSYRLPGEFWKVVIFQKADVPAIHCQPSKWTKPTRWEQEIAGMVIRFPRTEKVDRNALFQAMSLACGCVGWEQVEGPDSMVLR